MGLPLGTLVCATNKNNILADFFESGKYDKRRPFYTTVSPSMDILISSNLERLLWFTEGSEFTKAKMTEFSENNCYETEKGIFPDFVGGTCSEENTFAKIKEVFEKYGYCVDPHTAVAAYVADEYKKTDSGKMLIVSTASPYKFPYAVAEALEISECADDFEMLDKVSEYTKTEIPEPLKKLKNASVRFGKTVEPSKMKDEVVIFGDR
jgi:threonine synthase